MPLPRLLQSCCCSGRRRRRRQPVYGCEPLPDADSSGPGESRHRDPAGESRHRDPAGESRHHDPVGESRYRDTIEPSHHDPGESRNGTQSGGKAVSGFALVFSLYAQPPVGHCRGGGCGCDTEAAARLFRGLGLTVHSFHNADRQGLLAELQDVANADHGNFDCLAVALVSHASHNHDGGVGSQTCCCGVSLADLLRPFSGSRSLSGKPKLFFVIQHDDSDAPHALLTGWASSEWRMFEDFLICLYSASASASASAGGSCHACDCAQSLADALLGNRGEENLDLIRALTSCVTGDSCRVNIASTLTKELAPSLQARVAKVANGQGRRLK